MRHPERLQDYLEHILEAAQNVLVYTDGYQLDDFIGDTRTQQAVILNLIIIGEAATKIMDKYQPFTIIHHEIAWHGMRGMRNRIAHGYFDINLTVVWETIQSALPKLILQISPLLSETKL